MKKTFMVRRELLPELKRIAVWYGDYARSQLADQLEEAGSGDLELSREDLEAFVSCARDDDAPGKTLYGELKAILG